MNYTIKQRCGYIEKRVQPIKKLDSNIKLKTLKNINQFKSLMKKYKKENIGIGIRDINDHEERFVIESLNILGIEADTYISNGTASIMYTGGANIWYEGDMKPIKVKKRSILNCLIEFIDKHC